VAAGWSSEPVAWNASAGRRRIQGVRAVFSLEVGAAPNGGAFRSSEFVFENIAGELAKAA
jgi:hypothetical protein